MSNKHLEYSETGFYSFITWLFFLFSWGGAASDYVVLATLKLRDLSAFASYVLKLEDNLLKKRQKERREERKNEKPASVSNWIVYLEKQILYIF